MAYGLWDVSGSYIIPGTRTKGTFARMRIGDKDRQSASKHIAKILNDKHKRDLRGDHKFSDHFALYNLQWLPFTAAAKKEAEVPNEPAHS